MVLGPSTDSALASLLIVYANSSVGIALAQRLFDAAEVSMTPVSEALDAIASGSRHDVILLCPYLADDERSALLDACEARTPVPSVLEVADQVAPPGAHVRLRPGSVPADVHSILGALALPVAV